MTVYFLSKVQAALKLNGTYSGVIDIFERRIEIEPDQKMLAEVVPGNNAEQLNFFIDDNFFMNPPDFADVYMLGNDRLIYIKRFAPKNNTVKVIRQTKFYNNLITLFCQGNVLLSCEGETFELYELDDNFKNPTFKEETISGQNVLTISAKGCLCIISSNGKRVFYNSAESFKCGDMLEITVNFETCACAKALCTFSFDGEKMTLVSSKTQEFKTPPADVLHFAFFESVLTRGDYEKYLCDELKSKATALPAYLGDFIAVTVPVAKFYSVHGDVKAAGLVYPKNKNLFEVKYFGVEMKNGKIQNVFEAE